MQTFLNQNQNFSFNLKDWNKVILTQNPNFSIKWEMPLGYATSYLLPESIKTEKIKLCV